MLLMLFFLSWDRPNSLVKAAPTGKAATLINGRTLASVLIRLRHSKSSTNDFLVSCIIIDEMSMMTLKDLHDLDVHIRRITGLKTVFGGISIILCGDFLQLPPAGGRPLYKKPIDKINELIDVFSNNKKCGERELQEKEDIVENLLDLDKNISTHTNKNKNKTPRKIKQQTPFADEVIAYDIWYNHFDTVVYLEENMRFLKDPEWGEELAKARKGHWTERLIEIINDRLLHTNHEIQLNSKDIEKYLIDSVVSLPDKNSQTSITQTVFATPSNASKQAINHNFTKAITESMPNNILPIRVVADFWGQLQGLSDQDKNYVMGLDESKFGRLASFLDLVIGMSVMVTQNEEPLKGIANRTFGILEDIQFPHDTLFRQIYDEVLDVWILVPSKLPLLAWIRTNRGDGTMAHQ